MSKTVRHRLEECIVRLFGENKHKRIREHIVVLFRKIRFSFILFSHKPLETLQKVSHYRYHVIKPFTACFLKKDSVFEFGQNRMTSKFLPFSN